MSDVRFDVAIIGAGVVGAAIARALSHYRVRSVLLDAADDVGAGTSKANTAILHTGFDAKPRTLEATLVARGRGQLAAYAADVGIPVEPTGALLIAWTDEQRAAMPEITARAEANGYHGVRPVGVDELYRVEPHLGRGALAALAIPDEWIICPFTTPLAYATEAVANGITLRLGTRVTGVSLDHVGCHALATTTGVVRARWVVNAAGLYADTIDRLFGHADFTVTPRRGELLVYDKFARALVEHVLLPVPTSITKGVLVSPTVFGNVIVGPTAEDVPDRADTGATVAGLEGLAAAGRRLVPRLADEDVTAVYVGLRAATEHADYRVRVHSGQRYVCVGGIRSTGLTASMAIADYVLDGLRDAGLALERVADPVRIRMPNIGEAGPRPYAQGGEIVCHCERVTRDEILGATRAPVPACSLDGIRRRTRALMGRCQGFFCLARVAALSAEGTGRSIEELLETPR